MRGSGQSRTAAMILFSGVLFLTLQTHNSYGQDYAFASVSDDGILQLPLGEPLSSAYLVDVSSHSFSSEDEAMVFLKSKSGERFFFRPSGDLSMAVLFLNLEDVPAWTPVEWNAHLHAVFSANPFLPEGNESTND
jgi:hypothetical protein